MKGSRRYTLKRDRLNVASSSSHRSSFSRKAQYKAFLGYLVGFSGVLIGGILLGVALLSPSTFAQLRLVATGTVAPVGKASAQVRYSTIATWDTVAGYFTSGRDVVNLHDELNLAKIQLIKAQALEDENKRLKALLGVIDSDKKPITVARLIMSTASSTRRFATLDAGRNKGVTVGMPVRAPMGIVGRVLEAGPTTSRVILITDTENLVPIRNARDGTLGYTHGTGDGTLTVKLINLEINPLKVDDILVTSGSGGLYSPGNALARVTKITVDGAIAQVIADPSATEFIFVEPMWAGNAILQASQELSSGPIAGQGL